MLRQVYAVNRDIQFLRNDGIDNGQRYLVTFFGFKYLADVTILRVAVVGDVAAKAVNAIKNVVDKLYLLSRAGLVHHLYPDIALNGFYLVNHLLLVEVGVLIAVDNQDAL